MLVKKIRILSLSLALSALPVSASATSFSNVIVFGDSLSDSGNNAIIAANQQPPLDPPFQQVPFGSGDLIPGLPYESGRFTNGPTWVENLAASFDLEASPSLGGGTNFAFGGAKTGSLGAEPPSLLDQFGLFQSVTGGVAPSDALYVVWGGSNNLFDLFDAESQKQDEENMGATDPISQAVSDITTIVGGLTAAGAVNVVVPNVPNLGLTPLATLGTIETPGLDAALTDVSEEFNALLSEGLREFSSDPALNIIEVDVFAYIESIVASPGSFGLTNVTDPCVDFISVCDNPDKFLYYDAIHPTAAVHAQFAQFVRGQIVTVPEPSGLLGMGLAVFLGGWLSKPKTDKQLAAKQEAEAA